MLQVAWHGKEPPFQGALCGCALVDLLCYRHHNFVEVLVQPGAVKSKVEPAARVITHEVRQHVKFGSDSV